MRGHFGGGLGALALICPLLAVIGCGSRRGGELTIQPGQEQTFAAMLNPGAQSADCQWVGGKIERKFVVSRYRCSDSGPEHALTLRHRSLSSGAAVTTEKFALIAPTGFPPALLGAVAAQVRVHEGRFYWQSPSSRERGAASTLERVLERVGFRFRGGTQAAVALVASLNILALIGLLLARRHRPPADPSNAFVPSSPMAPAVAVVSAAVVAMMAARFRFQLDDYLYLERAHVCPECLDESLRVLSTDVLFSIGRLTGDSWSFFAACNVLILVSAAVLWAHLLRRLRSSADEAILAAALFTFAPGTYLLLRYGSGFQQLAANAVIFAVLLMVDGAARTGGREGAHWRRAQLAAAFALGMAGVLVKSRSW